MFDRIVVPLDGSAVAEQALAAATTLARLANAPIHLLRIIDFTRMETYGSYGLEFELSSIQPVISAENDAADEYLRDLIDALQKEGLSADYEVRHGHITREIVSATQPGDTIVMASHGRSGLSRFLIGSVAEDVVRNSEVPVLLIRADHTSESTEDTNS